MDNDLTRSRMDNDLTPEEEAAKVIEAIRVYMDGIIIRAYDALHALDFLQQKEHADE